MARAKKCDRCGMFYTENTKNPRLNYVAGGVSILKKGIANQDFDLCDGCMNDFLVFIFDYEPPKEPDVPEEPDTPVTPPDEGGEDPVDPPETGGDGDNEDTTEPENPPTGEETTVAKAKKWGLVK